MTTGRVAQANKKKLQIEMRERRRIATPVLAAIGGMVVPALIYLAFNAGDSSARGWGIAMGTDTGHNLMEPRETPADNINFLFYSAAVIKAVDKHAVVTDIRVLEKSGGKSGDYIRNSERGVGVE